MKPKTNNPEMAVLDSTTAKGSQQGQIGLEIQPPSDEIRASEIAVGWNQTSCQPLFATFTTVYNPPPAPMVYNQSVDSTLGPHLDRDEKGRPSIVGRRITVAHIAIENTVHGESAESIAEGYDLSLGEVYSALAYYHDHKSEINQAVTEEGIRLHQLILEKPDFLFKAL